ncbi:RTC4-like domain-containing protein [Corynascus novoguineensis]|uniref:Restriction of telomere capping protein 4 n=1 Tax=Corynascus novoguineensis TaxID=1126955 RepID=A0AAN7CZF1_9PEZI|nr:RTC4-like domain-containing protein [Corynascus novoguineensis]
MKGKRYVGLSSQQPVPHLLSAFGKKRSTKDIEDIDVDAPPLSSSDSSDDEGLPSRANIEPTQFRESRLKKSPSQRDTRKSEANGSATAPAERLKRTRASTRLKSVDEPGSSFQRVDRQPGAEPIDSDDVTSSPVSKKFKKSSPGSGELRSQFERDNIFKKTASRQYGSKQKRSGSKPRRAASPAQAFKPPPEESASETEDMDRYKLKLPSSPSDTRSEITSPARKFKPIPDFRSPEKPSPRQKLFTMPDDDNLVLSGDYQNTEESQRPVFTIPDEIPDPFIGDDSEKANLNRSPIANDVLNTSSLLREGPSSLTDVDSIDPIPLCPLCKKEVPRSVLDEFKATYPRMSVSGMRRFCEQHRRRSAREAWVARGYPEIEWQGLETRMAAHHGELRRILEGGTPSHYGALFDDVVRSGRNRTLLRSDANLTPGYYGLRGLRAMTENLIGAFAALLRRRAVEDRLVSARGYTAYLQAVLVPELAVRLIMEDMGVGEEEARSVLAESSDVGELLNDEVADVVLEDDDDDDDNDDDKRGDGDNGR